MISYFGELKPIDLIIFVFSLTQLLYHPPESLGPFSHQDLPIVSRSNCLGSESVIHHAGLNTL